MLTKAWRKEKDGDGPNKTDGLTALVFRQHAERGCVWVAGCGRCSGDREGPGQDGGERPVGGRASRVDHRLHELLHPDLCTLVGRLRRRVERVCMFKSTLLIHYSRRVCTVLLQSCL